MIKLPRGTQDYSGESYERLKYLKDTIENIFIKYHGKFVETPVFERTDVLMNKYGEEEKLIFNISSDNSTDVESDDIKCDSKTTVDKGSMEQEKLSLRYDHTVPLVRYCILNKIDKMRRCCIGKVYRRESSIRSQIRLREFYQADFDYVGPFDELVPELEIFCMIQELFKILSVNNYLILYNYRQNLDYYVREAGIEPKMFSTVCSSIDKLDKKDRNEVKAELLDKGLNSEQVDKLYKFLFSSDSLECVMCPDVKELDVKFNKYIDSIGILDRSKIRFVPTLARGSDYYTGIIFEVKLLKDITTSISTSVSTTTDSVTTDSVTTNSVTSVPTSVFTSSVSGGGRYDKLIPSYRKTDKDTCSEFPMIGFSFGVDRLIPLVKLPELTTRTVNIWVSTIGNIPNPTKIKLDLIGKLNNKGYGVFYNLSDKKFKKEIQCANENKCNFIIIIGENEWSLGKVSIKNMDKREQVLIDFEDIDEYFKKID